MKTQDELIEKLKKLERAEADWKLFKEEEEDLQQVLSSYLKKKSEVAASIEELKASFLQSLQELETRLLYTSPSPRDATLSRMPSSA